LQSTWTRHAGTRGGGGCHRGEGPADANFALGRGVYPLPQHSLAGRESLFSFLPPISCQGFLLVEPSEKLGGRGSQGDAIFGAQNRAEEGRESLEECTHTQTHTHTHTILLMTRL